MVEALRYITELASMKYKVEPYAVVIVPITEVGNEQFTRTFKVPPDFLTSTGGGGEPAGGCGLRRPDPFAAKGAAGATGFHRHCHCGPSHGHANPRRSWHQLP